MKDLKVIFMGTPEFSEPILKELIEKCNVIGVVTQPDKEIGRDKKIKFSPIKTLALENNIKVFQPVKIRNDYADILALNPDIIITCAYGQIIPKEILDFPKYGCINVHASLLPKLRGGAPIHHAIIDGYSETGITIMYMNEKMDEGDIISSESIPILDSDNLETLHDKLSLLGRDLLIKTLPDIINGTNNRIKQDDSKATYAYTIKREDERINFNKTSREIFNQIRGLNPFPGAYTTLDNKIVKVYDSYIKNNKYENLKNGEITAYYQDGIGVKTIDGEIVLTEIQFEGKKRMKTIDFLRGNKENLIGKIFE